LAASVTKETWWRRRCRKGGDAPSFASYRLVFNFSFTETFSGHSSFSGASYRDVALQAGLEDGAAILAVNYRLFSVKCVSKLFRSQPLDL
jgi:hypothetical protein